MNEILSKYKEEVEADPGEIPGGFQTIGGDAAALPGPARARVMSRAKRWPRLPKSSEISITDVASIAGFYSLYYEEPHGRYHIQVCNDLPCAMRGRMSSCSSCASTWAIEVGETTPDGLFTVEAVKCLAACHRAPMFQVQGDGDIVYHENQTLETDDGLDRRSARAD